MDGAEDERIRTTRKKIESAFLELKKNRVFEDISVADVCRQAGVSRSTFYSRYGTMDNLLISVIDSILSNLSFKEKTLNIHRWDDVPDGPPMCLYVRSHPETHGLFYDSRMHDIIVERNMRRCSDKNWEIMSEYGDIGREQFEDLQKYQMYGCLSLMKEHASSSDEVWEKSKHVIDKMIRIHLVEHII